MTEFSLEQLVTTERSKALAIEARLTKRRAAEAAELELLESDLARATAKKQALDAHVVTVSARNDSLATEAQTLERGLSLSGRWWVRLGEPVLGAVALFVSFLSVGLTRTSGVTAVLEGIAFFAGASGSAALRMWRRRR